MAHEVAQEYSCDVDPEHVPHPKEYVAIARALGVTLDVYMLYAGDLIKFTLNVGHEQVVKVFYCGSGEGGVRESKGRFGSSLSRLPHWATPLTTVDMAVLETSRRRRLSLEP